MIRNEVKLIGRLTADPELKYTKNSNIMRCQNQKIYHFNGGKNYVQNHFSR